MHDPMRRPGSGVAPPSKTSSLCMPSDEPPAKRSCPASYSTAMAAVGALPTPTVGAAIPLPFFAVGRGMRSH